MKKRVLALVMSTAMIASVLTACGGNSNDGGSASDTSNTTTGDNSASADNEQQGIIVHLLTHLLTIAQQQITVRQVSRRWITAAARSRSGFQMQ